ncbi:hypothetical protein LTT66_02780 [Nocardia gipuzkoensis]|uniref:hypothetical protein n=1 Tax=Nocardia gipuzkoensis TaxID=2749991 RepID=UPI001E5CBE05|nr:hypothetical protein [Nocardia gipuzkoensis]UGT69154.1 hypothetical protein LTT66_02780 [Nocardia gipuzkoensis]
MSEATLVAPPSICAIAEVAIAHRQMQRHRACRIDLCAWKWVAYYMLVYHGRITPPKLSPRERAYVRGISFPTENTDTDRRSICASLPKPQTFQQVLDGLTALAHDKLHPSDTGSER